MKTMENPLIFTDKRNVLTRQNDWLGVIIAEFVLKLQGVGAETEARLGELSVLCIKNMKTCSNL